MSKFTVKDLLTLADNIRASNMNLDEEVYISLEVTKNESDELPDENTSCNRVFGGDKVEVGVINTMSGKFVKIQLIGEPNFEVYK